MKSSSLLKGLKIFGINDSLKNKKTIQWGFCFSISWCLQVGYTYWVEEALLATNVIFS